MVLSRNGRVAWPNIVAVMLGFVLFADGGCRIGGDCSCPSPAVSATIELGCTPAAPPVVKTTGPCSVCPQASANGMIPEGSGCAVPDNAAYVVLLASGAGICHAEVTFAGGTTSSVDVDFVSEQQPACCGGGGGFIPVTADGGYDNPTLRDPACDAREDGGPSD
jgi:hypothetical protein